MFELIFILILLVVGIYANRSNIKWYLSHHADRVLNKVRAYRKV